ncbi:hypothetical protein TSUD_81470 [Trifolium subterraneum]|uniref:TIR domain-containing protein n=1 Tax=Trifolium subterraneum TaxID=3900 RepID=A0A2Z6NXC7_TRISU|nr:hypothetical protein TSUD_81470 [Trifolium subterraneum]
MSHPATPKYDVFLSFRGVDTRDNFTSHLYAELCRKKIETFIDYRLKRGDEINSSLIKAIEESLIYVVILSKHYASSSWCLDELTEILKCKEKYGREVIPVFYEVDPADVRHQRKSYADDFAKHQERNSGKVDEWKAALNQVAGLSGWHSQVTRPESKLVIETVNDIVKKLNRCVLSNYQGMIGIDKHIEQIQTLLHLESSSIIGIWGMGGIGKSTIASAIYSKLITNFNSGCIILNVYQEIEKIGLQSVRIKYLSQLLGEEITSSEYNFTFDPRLKRIKVLLVFDDVKDSDQLEHLIGTPGNFGKGSRIIVTSRDKQVLKNANVDETKIYEVTKMDSQDSLQLFFSFAFKRNNPEEPYVSLSKKVLNYAQGLPLALKVLGKFLQGRQKEEWESQLQKLEKLPHPDIFNLLKLSYDGLDDDQKNIFLDIACFYRGEYVKVVEHTLDCCGFFTRIGMKVLEDRNIWRPPWGPGKTILRPYTNITVNAMEQEQVVETESDEDTLEESQALWDTQVPPNFKIPHLPTFDGKTDPLEHLMAVGTQTSIIGAEEHLKCKKFINQFSGSKHIQVTATTLFGIHQRSDENLREYLARFSEETIKVSNPNQEMFVAAFQKGLKAGHFNESLAQKPAETMQEVMKRAQCYIKGEESNAEKRDRDSKERSSYRRSPERRGSSRQSRHQGRNSDTPYQRPWYSSERNKLLEEDLTSLNSKRVHVLDEILSAGLARLPQAPDRNVRMGPNSDEWCHYHRCKGHDTKKCFRLKELIEKLISSGHLRKFIEQAAQGATSKRTPPYSPRDTPGQEKDKLFCFDFSRNATHSSLETILILSTKQEQTKKLNDRTKGK